MIVKFKRKKKERVLSVTYNFLFVLSLRPQKHFDFHLVFVNHYVVVDGVGCCLFKCGLDRVHEVFKCLRYKLKLTIEFF